jgi:type 1 glutamine amidotransferase
MKPALNIINQTKRWILGLVIITSVLLSAVSVSAAAAEAPIKVLVISGQNNHDWAKSTPYLEKLLNRTDRFQATVNNAPGPKAPQAAWDAWQPRFRDFGCVLLNYNGEAWPERVKKDFVEYVRNGGGIVVIHAANNAFTGWKEYEQMVGLLWRGKEYGDSLYFDKEGNIVREKAGEGRGMGHGGQYDWVMTTRDAFNPITQGMPLHWMHAKDELYHGQRGPAADMHILLSAYSDPKNGGTGYDEPIVWWVPFGKGKVLTNVMGHVGETTPLECVGFQVILLRSVEWLSTGECRTPLPENFPTENQTRRNTP